MACACSPSDALFVAALGAYAGPIVLSFALWPADIPDVISSICLGNIEEELYGLMWPQFEDIPADSVDKTWRMPTIAAAAIYIAFVRELVHQHAGLRHLS